MVAEIWASVISSFVDQLVALTMFIRICFTIMVYTICTIRSQINLPGLV